MTFENSSLCLERFHLGFMRRVSNDAPSSFVVVDKRGPVDCSTGPVLF